MTRVVARAPGRVNLIGDHTDYTGGLVLPMAIDWATTVTLDAGGHVLELVSEVEREPAVLDLRRLGEPNQVQPPWARYVAGVVAVLRPTVGGKGTITTQLPVGAGLSSSAALEVAVALALGLRGTPHEVAAACQEAEHLASGVPTGIMDQLTSAGGISGNALLIDCRTLEIQPVPLPDEVEIVVVDSGQRRALVSSAYAERRRQCEEAAARIGPLRDATLDDVATLEDPVLRRRARHVVSENGRVRAFATALVDGDVGSAGTLMLESHASLRDDYEVSTPELDRIVDSLCQSPGVFGARLTGAGFGGCVVALAEPAAPVEGWRFTAAAGASVTAGG